jgi:hypothetical protein
MKTQADSAGRIGYGRFALGLCLAAGILYNSWPLGYILDNATAHAGLASDLELVGHPYYWLFVGGDVLAAILTITAAVLLLRYSKMPSRFKILIASGLLAFGLFTAVSSLLPSQCTVTPLLRCGAGHGQGLGLDAATSTIAALGIFASLSGLAILIKNKSTRIILTAWTVTALVFVGIALTNGNAQFAQDILMILSGVAILVIGLDLNASLKA